MRLMAEVKCADRTISVHVWEESPGVYRDQVFDRPKQGGAGGASIGQGTSNSSETLEDAKRTAERDLRAYIRVAKLDCPDFKDISWNEVEG